LPLVILNLPRWNSALLKDNLFKQGDQMIGTYEGKRKELLKFLNQKVFDPILRALPEDYDSEDLKGKLSMEKIWIAFNMFEKHKRKWKDGAWG
jgi:hypothetical protein